MEADIVVSIGSLFYSVFSFGFPIRMNRHKFKMLIYRIYRINRMGRRQEFGNQKAALMV